MSHINLVKFSCQAIKRFLFIFVILFSLTFAGPVFGAEILFITGKRVYESDVAIQNNLESHGSVTVIQDCDAQYTDALEKDLVFISESVYSRKINTAFRNLPIPIIVSEPWLLNDMGMTGSRYAIDFGRARKQSSIIVNESKHDLTAGLSREVSISHRQNTIGWGVPGPDALKIATLNDDPAKCTVFAYDKGMQMPGLVAPAKRLSFFLYRKTASFLTSEGWALFHAAVKWALTPDLIEPITIKVVSDASWKAQIYYGNPVNNWFAPEYVDKYWPAAYAPFPEPDSSKVSKTDGAFIWYWSSDWGLPEQNYWGPPQAWFRKTFEIPGDPSNFKIQDLSIESRGGPVVFYINGEHILEKTDKNNITRKLAEGKNVIALYSQAADTTDPDLGFDHPHKGVWFNLTLETEPEEKEDSPVKKALLVVGRIPLSYSDRALKIHLERLGFLVFLADDATVDKADADDMDFILISETVWSKLIGDLFRDVAVPVLCLESYLYDDLYMSGSDRNSDYGNSRRRRTIAVTDSGHSLSAGMSDSVKVTTRRRRVGWGVPAESALIIASLVNQPERAAIFAYNTGALMAEDYIAPQKRIGMFLHGNSAPRLTAAGWELFDAAVKWAIAEQN